MNQEKLNERYEAKVREYAQRMMFAYAAEEFWPWTQHIVDVSTRYLEWANPLSAWKWSKHEDLYINAAKHLADERRIGFSVAEFAQIATVFALESDRSSIRDLLVAHGFHKMRQELNERFANEEPSWTQIQHLTNWRDTDSAWRRDSVTENLRKRMRLANTTVTS